MSADRRFETLMNCYKLLLWRRHGVLRNFKLKHWYENSNFSVQSCKAKNTHTKKWVSQSANGLVVAIDKQKAYFPYIYAYRWSDLKY